MEEQVVKKNNENYSYLFCDLLNMQLKTTTELVTVLQFSMYFIRVLIAAF
jgi:hypothetical protein